MPYFDVETTHGTVNFHYLIATPSNSNAKVLDPNLPTVLLLHPEYLDLEIFHTQFLDPRTRRFNLLALDLLDHGRTSGKVPERYGPKELAEDVIKFMDAINLAPCFVVGMSMGTVVAIQLAITDPSRILGLFLISPLGTEEPSEVIEGREEVFACWTAVVKSEYDEALEDTVFGAMQLAVSNSADSLTHAQIARAIVQAKLNWPAEKLDVCRTVIVKFLIDRKSHSKEALSRLKDVPVELIYGSANVAYSKEYFEIFFRQLQDANVDVVMQEVVGVPHVPTTSLKHAVKINPILERFVEERWTGGPIPPAQSPTDVSSPFDDVLREAGWAPEEDLDDE